MWFFMPGNYMIADVAFWHFFDMDDKPMPIVKKISFIFVYEIIEEIGKENSEIRIDY